MMLVDSHCHLDMLDLSQFDDNMDNVIGNAKAHDVQHLLCVSVAMKTLPDIAAIAERYDCVHYSVGVHPNERDETEVSFDALQTWAKKDKVVAIGETGLDYYRCAGDMAWQQERFCRHIAVAKTEQLPIIIHTRQARDDTIAIMKAEQADAVGGVMHCFTETWEMAKAAIDLGFYISLSGIVTFKNAKDLQEVAKKVPSDRLLVETDSPYLAPVPFRGKPNQPAYVRQVAEFVANLRGESYEQLAQTTTENFFHLFPKARNNKKALGG